MTANWATRSTPDPVLLPLAPPLPFPNAAGTAWGGSPPTGSLPPASLPLELTPPIADGGGGTGEAALLVAPGDGALASTSFDVGAGAATLGLVRAGCSAPI
jgi:hypothetical protein